ncbi:hypothetical protein [Kribbella amoyensis]|uniref:hypothetical protein n=1 Tax=Kribbella amoyensis TaxID=996641 RepID=UPI00119DA369|nr:hypothetical protein [Kribbella amoyensis]
MNWPEGSKGQILAGVYLIAFVAMVTGLVLALYNQATGGDGAQLTAGFALFVVAQLTITAIAVGLRSTLPDEADFKYQRVWHRLTLGRELATAMRLLRP